MPSGCALYGQRLSRRRSAKADSMFSPKLARGPWSRCWTKSLCRTDRWIIPRSASRPCAGFLTSVARRGEPAGLLLSRVCATFTIQLTQRGRYNRPLGESAPAFVNCAVHSSWLFYGRRSLAPTPRRFLPPLKIHIRNRSFGRRPKLSRLIVQLVIRSTDHVPDTPDSAARSRPTGARERPTARGRGKR